MYPWHKSATFQCTELHNSTGNNMITASATSRIIFYQNIFFFCFPGTIVPPGKARGGSPYNQFDIVPGDPLGGHTGPAGDSWLPAKSPPTSKIGSKSSNASWPPGNFSVLYE